MTLSERIDQFLNDTLAEKYWFLSEEDPDNQYVVVQKAVTYGLVVKNRMVHELTQKGHEVIEAGGFDKWHKTKQKREDEAHQATLDSSDATVKSARYTKQSRNAAWVASIVAIVATAYSVYQEVRAEMQDNKINALQIQLDTLKSQLKVQSQSPKALEDAPQNQKTK